jgi:ATP/maltotriose-dependent transcriptional regulator MalT
MSGRAIARSSTTNLDRGREAFRKQAWKAAFSSLLAADQESPLAPEDLLHLAQSAQLTGRDADAFDLLGRAHQAFLSEGDKQKAARCAFVLGFALLFNGDMAQAGGWLARANRILENEPACAERGYLLLPTGYRSFYSGDCVKAREIFVEATAIGQRFADNDLVAFGLMGQGRSLIRQGEIAQGVALLDEAMVAVTSGEVSPMNAGAVFCSVLDGCGEIYDLQRAQEWTLALERWCAQQPDLVPYRGHCLLRRSELQQIHGCWSEALETALRAKECLSQPAPKSGLGIAFYQAGEIYRLRGEFAEAENAYQRATQFTRNLGPGLAQLWLAQGRVETAYAAIRTMVEEVPESGLRAKVLEAYVEIALAAGDVPSAQLASDELKEMAEHRGIPFFRGLSCYASGSLLFASNDARGALAEFRHSWRIWSDLDAPYLAARAQLKIGEALRALGDEDSARVETNAAFEILRKIGARDISRIGAGEPVPGPLTDREIEVLRLVATGMTNRAIANKLHISEKTVARHISNIFTKLDISSRTAAAAYAYDHKLV